MNMRIHPPEEMILEIWCGTGGASECYVAHEAQADHE